VVVPGGGEGVNGAEVDEDGTPGVEVGQGDIPRAFWAGRKGDLFLARDSYGTEDLRECIPDAMVAFSQVVGFATHEMVPERIHRAPAHWAGVERVPCIERNAQPPPKGDTVMGRGEGERDAVMGDGEHPGGGEGLGLEAKATFVAGSGGGVEGVSQTGIKGC
jgi:hypothetical protein